jgi:hypothetical protein
VTQSQRKLREEVANLIGWPTNCITMPRLAANSGVQWFFADSTISAKDFLDPRKAFQGVKLNRLPSAEHWAILANKLLDVAERL